MMRMLLYFTLVIRSFDKESLVIKSNMMAFYAPSDVFRDYISLYSLCRECFDF
jgi:hypothetical protein